MIAVATQRFGAPSPPRADASFLRFAISQRLAMPIARISQSQFMIPGDGIIDTIHAVDDNFCARKAGGSRISQEVNARLDEIRTLTSRCFKIFTFQRYIRVASGVVS